MKVSLAEKVSLDSLLEVGHRVDVTDMWGEGIPKAGAEQVKEQ